MSDETETTRRLIVGAGEMRTEPGVGIVIGGANGSVVTWDDIRVDRLSDINSGDLGAITAGSIDTYRLSDEGYARILTALTTEVGGDGATAERLAQAVRRALEGS